MHVCVFHQDFTAGCLYASSVQMEELCSPYSSHRTHVYGQCLRYLDKKYYGSNNCSDASFYVLHTHYVSNVNNVGFTIACRLRTHVSCI